MYSTFRVNFIFFHFVVTLIVIINFKLAEPAADYVKASVDTVIKISRTERSGDALLFLTGHEEVETAVRLLRDYAQNAADSSRIGQ